MTLAELASLALLGTERQELSRPIAGTRLSALQSSLDFAQRETALLSAAALAAAHERAGRVPSVNGVSPVMPCEAETLTQCGPRSGAILARMLTGEFEVLLQQWLRCAGAFQQLAPPEILPALLGRGSANASLREDILRVIGKRGLWLGAQNPEWSWVVGAEAGDETAWQTGDPRARVLFLRALRRSLPDRARELLITSWSQESPEERVALLDTLSTGLGSSDEAFLETVLDDKRKEVRRKASVLLCRLPASRLAMRMVERAASFLRFMPGETGSVLRLKKGKPAVIEVALPTNCDRAMQRDGVELKPQQGIGEKAFWLIQILEAVPLDYWIQEWSVTPGEVLAASLNSEWKTELLEAWTRASIRQTNVAWAESLLDLSADQLAPGRIQELIGVLPASHRERHVLGLLEDEKRGELHGRVIMQLEQDWSPEFSRAVLKWLRNLTEQQSMDWQLRSTIKICAIRIDPGVLPEVADNWPVDSIGWNFWSKGVDEMLSLARFRHDLLIALEQKH